MKFSIPIYPVVDVQDAAQAEQLRVKLEQLLNQPQIKMLLAAQGVPIVSATAGPAYQVDERAMAAQAVPRRR
jgi:hypothetical protein